MAAWDFKEGGSLMGSMVVVPLDIHKEFSRAVAMGPDGGILSDERADSNLKCNGGEGGGRVSAGDVW